MTFETTAQFGNSEPNVKVDTYPVEFRQTDTITHEIGLQVETPWGEFPIMVKVVTTFDPPITWVEDDC